MLNTVDGGHDVAAVGGVEIPLQENTAYISYNSPQAAAGDLPRVGESGDEDVYEYI